jgi:hypothetical protein
LDDRSAVTQETLVGAATSDVEKEKEVALKEKK